MEVRVTLSHSVLVLAFVGVVGGGFVPEVGAQEPSEETFTAAGIPYVPLPDPSVEFGTAERQGIRVSVVAAGLTYPWGFAFLPDGRILVTERLGAVRVITAGRLEEAALAGIPEVHTEQALAGLMDVSIHPNFAQNRWVYLTYSQTSGNGSVVTLARGRLDGGSLTEVRELFVSNTEAQAAGAARMAWAADGHLFLSVGGAFGGRRMDAQDLGSHLGKMLRLRDDGTAPLDNPFVGQEGAAPEVYSLGHRNQMGIAIHPETGEVWASEHAPQGGDEINIIRAGGNYGWPVVSYSREYTGQRITERPWQDGMVQPEIIWIPSIGPSGLMFYAGDRFPAWQGDLFAGSLMTGRIERTGHLERIRFNRRGMEQRREWLLAPLRRRIRDVQQGPDGLIYVLTAGQFLGIDPVQGEGAILRIEPVP
ncbi:MAG: hypothetical protein CL483_14525 [Acidobacteria bacterium]|nr:hypothetical protein [Acidobacteriota bacterium]